LDGIFGVADSTQQRVEDAAVEPPRRRISRRRVSARTVAVLAAAAALGGAVAGCRPTGTPVVDPLYSAALAALVTYACSRASRGTLLVFSAVAVVMSRTWLEIPAVAALLVAFFSVFPEHSRRRVGALVGALGVEALLRWPPVGFHGATALVAGAALAPVFFSALRRISKTQRRRAKQVLAAAGAAAVVLTIPLLVAAAMARGDISTGQTAAQGAFGDVSNGSSASATSNLSAATVAFASASSKLGSWWSALGAVVPLVAQQRQALATAAATATDVVAVAEHEAPNFDYHQLGYHQGQVDLGRISAMLGPAQVLDRSLSAATTRLGALRSGWLVAPLQSRLRIFDQSLLRARSTTDLAVKAIPLVPDMLGAKLPQHYFVALVSPAESRGLDGIVGAYGELTAVGGHLSLTVSGPDTTLDSALPARGGVLTGLSDFIDRYGRFAPEKYIQDVTFSPDFPTVADVISELYPQAGGDHLDGVLMLDPYGLARLLSITGSVAVPGFAQPLTSQDAATVLLKGQYLGETVTNAANQTARHDLLQDALHVTFQRLVDGSLPGPRLLSQDLEPAVLGGRIAFWSAHPADGALLQALHLEDAFPKAGGGDLVAVTAQNAGANKIDAYLHVSTVDHVLVDPATGAVTAALSISLRNDAPASGLPPIVIDSPGVPGTPPGSNYCWVSIYSPFAFTHATFDGQTATLAVGRELGVNVYSQWFLVPPQSTATLALSLGGAVTAGSPYALHLRLQPMANPATFQATVASTASPGSEATWTAGPEVDQVHVFAGR